MGDKTRNYNIDLVKGILIILVITGHIIPGILSETFSRYIIYSFHMPIFIGISGYLIDINKIRTISFKDLFNKYWKRVIIPWILAVNVYFVLDNISLLGQVDIGVLVKRYGMAYIYPYYHLWFVLGFLAYIFLTWLILISYQKIFKGKFKHAQMTLFVVAFIISIVSNFIDRIRFSELLDEGYAFIQYDLRLYNYIFFIIGIIVRANFMKLKDDTKKKIFNLSLILAICFFIATVILYFGSLGLVGKVVFYLLNISLLIFTLVTVVNEKLPRNKLLEFIGINSLAFYLWHVGGRYVAEVLVGKENLVLYYIVNVIIIVFEIIFVYFGKKVKVIDKYLFGN